MQSKLLAVVLAIASPCSARAGKEALRGTESDFWERYSVVYGEIASIEDERDLQATVTLHIQATLGGSFDAARDFRVTGVIPYGGIPDSLQELPPVKSRIVAVLWKPHGSYEVTRSPVSFMPGILRPPLVAVKGFDDPVVQKIISRLRELRKAKPPRGQSTDSRG
jgi:hypothetical protein